MRQKTNMQRANTQSPLRCSPPASSETQPDHRRKVVQKVGRLRQSFVTFVLLAICGLVPFSPCPCFIVPPPLIRMAASIALPSGPKSSLKRSGPCSSVVLIMKLISRVHIINFSLVLLAPFSNSHYLRLLTFAPSLGRT